MTDALVIRNEQQGTAIAAVDIASELPAIFQLARALIKATGFIPAHLKNEGEIAAVVLAGRELGLQPMVSLRSIAMVKGKPVLAADVMLGLMLRAGVKHEWVADGSPAQGNVARIKLTRAGHEPYVSSFSIEDAQRAGLASNDNYKKHQGAMLRARAVSAGGRAYCPDILSGCYVPGELGEDEPQSAPRAASKSRRDRTLDDVAEVAAPRPFAEPETTGQTSNSTTGHTKTSPETETTTDHDADGVVPGSYTFAQHMEALGLCGVDALQAWVDELHALQPTQQQKRQAWSAFQGACLVHNVDPQQYATKGDRS